MNKGRGIRVIYNKVALYETNRGIKDYIIEKYPKCTEYNVVTIDSGSFFSTSFSVLLNEFIGFGDVCKLTLVTDDPIVLYYLIKSCKYKKVNYSLFTYSYDNHLKSKAILKRENNEPWNKDISSETMLRIEKLNDRYIERLSKSVEYEDAELFYKMFNCKTTCNDELYHKVTRDLIKSLITSYGEITGVDYHGVVKQIEDIENSHVCENTLCKNEQ